MAIPWTGWNEIVPENTEAFSLGDDRIRELKLQMRDLISVDHYMPTSSGQSSDWGRHNMVTLLEQASNPDTVSTAYILFTKEVASHSELHCKTPAGTVIQLTSAGKWVGGMSMEIRMWAGSLATIPTGWHLCDGSSYGSGNYPNLLAKFLMGVPIGTTTPGGIHGSDELTLGVGQIPAHTHPDTVTSTDGAHTHTLPSAGGLVACVSGAASYYILRDSDISLYTATQINHAHNAAETSYTADASETLKNIPIYIELGFICRVRT